MNKHSRIATIATITLLIATMTAGCSKKNENRGAAQADPSPERASAETRSAAASLTQSRCAREQRCENVGPGKKYSSVDDCDTQIGRDWREDLNSRECSRGINQQELDDCLSQIRNEDCGNPFDSLERIAACRQGMICQD
ncbi:MAG TPA: DUF6184 family natural product biosynthesis lipoprotein [Polyangiaceae bacterium]|nr:DUF6184 family natural product biosynthesis lipoprotein [Polyangiaceae bacterium]